MPESEDDVVLRGSVNDFLGSSRAEFIHVSGMPAPLPGVEITLVETEDQPTVTPAEANTDNET